MKITGNWATLLLPITKEDINKEDIDFDLLAAQIDYFIEAKVDGIYSNGTAGEFYTQSEQEFEQISQLLATKCKQAGVPFQIGASHCHPNESVARAQFAASLNPTAIQVILPNWFPCNTETALTFLKKVESVCNGVPLILYNPPHAKVCLSAQQLKTLFDEVETLVGFKLPRITDEIAATGLAQDASIFVAGHFLATDAYKGALQVLIPMCVVLIPRATQAMDSEIAWHLSLSSFGARPKPVFSNLCVEEIAPLHY